MSWSACVWAGTLGLWLSVGQARAVEVGPQRQVDQITKALEAGEVRRVEILHVPARVTTETRVTPQALERSYWQKITIRDLRVEPCREGFQEAVASVVVTSAHDMPDLRWGVLVYGTKGRRLGALYFDRTGARGAVGKTPVAVRGTLFSWSRRMLNNFGP